MSTVLEPYVEELPKPPPPLEETLQNGASLYELVGGKLVEKKMSALSTLTAARVHLRLGAFVEDQNLGWVAPEMVFILDYEAGMRRRPDVAFISAERWPLDRRIPQTGDWELAPDLAIEVTSPHDKFTEVLEKVDDYFRYEVREVWIVVPEKRRIFRFTSPTQVRILMESDQIEGAPLIPGWQIRVGQLFPPQVPETSPPRPDRQ